MQLLWQKSESGVLVVYSFIFSSSDLRMKSHFSQILQRAVLYVFAVREQKTAFVELTCFSNPGCKLK